MRPVAFHGFNSTLTAPQGQTESECGPLNCFRDGINVVSCWELSFWELIKLIHSGRIWLCSVSGETSPPFAMSVDPLVSDRDKAPVDAEPTAHPDKSTNQSLTELVRSRIRKFRFDRKAKEPAPEPSAILGDTSEDPS